MTSSQEQNRVVISLHKPALIEQLFFLASGIIASVPLTLFIDQFADSALAGLPEIYAVLLSAVILAPFLEEFAKAFPLFYRHGETQRSIFTLGFLVGLGFGVFEFFTYVLLLQVSPIVRLPGIFFHAANTSIVAYGIATKRPLPFYLIAVALHFTNNFSAFLSLPGGNAPLLNLGFIGSYLATVLTYLLSWRFYRKTSETMVS